MNVQGGQKLVEIQVLDLVHVVISSNLLFHAVLSHHY